MTTTNPTPTQQETLKDEAVRLCLAMGLPDNHACIRLAENYLNSRAAVAGPRGDAAFIQKVAALPCARVDGDECFYFEKEVATYCASCHAKYLIETAATSSPTPAESDLISREVAVEITDARLKDVPDTVDLEADRSLFAAGYLAAAGSIKAALLRQPAAPAERTRVEGEQPHWDVVSDPDGVMHHVAWSERDREGRYMMVRHYPDKWRAERQAKEFNDKGRLPSEWFDWHPAAAPADNATQ